MTSIPMVVQMNRSILMLASHFPPENNIASERPFRFYKYLPRCGYDVHVVTASPQDGECDQENVLWAFVDGNSGTRGFDPVLSGLLRPLITKDSLRWALGAFRTAERVIQEKKPDLIFSTSPPVISNMVAACLKQRYGIPWVADFRDPMVGNPDRNGGGISHLRDLGVERWTFRCADALIANTDSVLEMWKRNYPQYVNKLHVIWNGFDPEDKCAAAPVADRGYRLLVHAGGMHRARHAEILLSGFRRLIQQGRIAPTELRVRFVGTATSDWNSDPATVEELLRVGFLEYDGQLVPKERARKEMATADALILFDWIAKGGSVQVPAKLYEYVRIGRPVLASTTRNSPAERILIDSGIRSVSIYPEDSSVEVDQKLLRFLTLPTEPVIARRQFFQQFDAFHQTRSFACVLDRFTGSRVPQ